MNTILVVYHWRKKKNSGVGNVDCSVDGDVRTMSSIRDMESQICEKFGFDKAIILNIIPLGNGGVI